jgi:hypothetical protein
MKSEDNRLWIEGVELKGYMLKRSLSLRKGLAGNSWDEAMCRRIL